MEKREVNEREMEESAVSSDFAPMRFEFASDLWSRVRGLLNPAICSRGEVLVLIPCNSIHTFGMKEPIDVAFVNRRGCVLKAQRFLPPNRLLSCKGATCTLERRSVGDERWFKSSTIIELTT
jgi:uncharacterized membrane protein (UPF0127 family)